MHKDVLSTELLLTVGRFRTFKNWPHDENSNCSALKMAKAGFVCCNVNDSVMCYFCLKTLEEWEESDDPMEEHRRHQPNCKFVNIDKPEEDFLISDLLDLMEARVEHLLAKKHEEERKLRIAVWENFKKSFKKK